MIPRIGGIRTIVAHHPQVTLGHGHVEGTLAAGHLAVGDVWFVDLDAVDADLAGGAHAGDAVAAHTDHPLDEGLLPARGHEARELSESAHDGRGRHLGGAEPAERVVKDDDVSAVNIRAQRVHAGHGDAIVLDQCVTHRGRGDPKDLHDEGAKE